MTKSNPLKTYDEKNRFMVAHLVGEHRTGETFTTWPQHITVMPWFSATEYEALMGFADSIKVIESVPVKINAVDLGYSAKYGHEHSTNVRPIRDSVAIGVMHGILLAHFGKAVIDKTFVGGRYSPHMTVNDQDPGLGAAYVIDSLCLVKHAVKHKTIIAAERFGHEETA
jgi:hypothetical protein